MSVHEILLKRFKPNPNENVDQIDDSKKIDNDSSLNDFKFSRILKINNKNKQICLECEFENKPAVLILEKNPFDESLIEKIGNNFGQIVQCGKNLFRNDIYGSYLIDLIFNDLQDDRLLNRFFMSMIHPASQKDIEKYQDQSITLIRETPEIYENFTKPYIEQQTSEVGNLKWLYNILDGKAEVDRVVYSCEQFIMVKDMKWKSDSYELTDLEKTEIYINALVVRKDLKTLRDLRQEHLPLLETIYQKGRTVLADKYKILQEELRVFIHYQPSFYHLHVHFTHIKNEQKGFQCERAHPLSLVIENIRLVPDYYQKITLEFPLAKNSEIKINELNTKK